MKKNRHEAILSLISQKEIGTQDELMQMLNDLGYKVTQATVSRDIKFLKLIKISGSEGQYKYAVGGSDAQDFSGKYYSIISHSVTNVDYAGNMAVVKCFAGMANAACAAMDSLKLQNIVGTLAGDDTIFVLCRSEESAAEFKAAIEEIIEKNI